MLLSLALAAPLDDAAIQALLARDGLESPPYEDTCCGEGGRTHTKTRWAELTGSPPEELLLTVQEYEGEGCATHHHYLYDVSGEPVALGELSAGGYDVFPYLDVVDLDADGVSELMAIGPASYTEAADWTLHRWEAGGLVAVGPVAAGRVYLPFDVDGDGRLEVVALGGEKTARVTVLGRDGKPVQSPVDSWLPRLFTTSLASTHHRTETTLTLLTKAMGDRGLAPSDPAGAFESVVARIEAGDGPTAYATSVWWPGSTDQRRRLEKVLGDTEREDAAALLLLATKGERTAVLEWVWGRVRAAAAGEVSLPSHDVAAALSPAEVEGTCALAQQVLLGDGDAEGRGDLAFWALTGPLHCLDAAEAVLGKIDLPRQVLRGAIVAVDRASYDDDVAARLVGREQVLAEGLLRLLVGSDAGLAAEAARALRPLGDHGAALRGVLSTATHPELQRSVLVALDEVVVAEPQVFLDALGRPTTTEVRQRLHSQLARSPSVDVVRRGLAEVHSVHDYSAYHWRAVYRTESLQADPRDLLRTDAAARLAHDEPRMRQSAAQVLGALGPGEHASALRAVAASDPEPYVREAAREALD